MNKKAKLLAQFFFYYSKLMRGNYLIIMEHKITGLPIVLNESNGKPGCKPEIL